MLAPLDPILPARRRTPLAREVRRNLRALIVDTPIVVGCSGGPDSTALVVALAALGKELGQSLHVVAIDHQLRPSAACEAEAVRDLAERLSLSAEVIAVQVLPGASRMAQSRIARYEALAAVARRRGARLVAVGHTRDDQAETVLMRLLGGAGLTGLSGMAIVAPFPTPAPDLRIVRPLLSVSRSEVEAFLQPLRPLLAPLPYADPTNRDPRYLRTRMRDEVLPLLRQLAPHLDEHLLQLADQLRADAEHLDGEAARALLALEPTFAEGTVRLSVRALSGLSRALSARVLRLVTQRYLEITLGQRHVEALRGLCESASKKGALDLPGFFAQRRHDVLLLSRRARNA